MVLYFYQQAFSYNDFGYGAAIAWGIFVIVGVFTVDQLATGRPSRRTDPP